MFAANTINGEDCCIKLKPFQTLWYGIVSHFFFNAGLLESIWTMFFLDGNRNQYCEWSFLLDEWNEATDMIGQNLILKAVFGWGISVKMNLNCLGNMLGWEVYDFRWSDYSSFLEFSNWMVFRERFCLSPSFPSWKLSIFRFI